MCVCVCVCVRERDRERERENTASVAQPEVTWTNIFYYESRNAEEE